MALSPKASYCRWQERRAYLSAGDLQRLWQDRRHRRGSVYLMVLGAAVIVTILGLSALTAVRIQRRSADGLGDFAEARRYAQSAIELGLLAIHDDPDWRENQLNGNWITDKAIGRGTYSLDGIDPLDGDLADDSSDPLVLTGSGNVGGACCKLSVRLVPYGPPGMRCLEVAMHSGDTLSFDNAIVHCDQTISSNDDISGWFADVYADLEAVNGIWGWDFHGSQTIGVSPRAIPDGTVLDYYVTNGTPININDLPNWGHRMLVWVVLSPANNPYGALNAEGIYVIDCAGESIIIEDCRIVGTLVLLNAGSDSAIRNSVNWEPAVSNYPALLVSGDMSFDFGASALDEDVFDVNFNPPGTPYEGSEDDDTDDTYPSVIKGIVNISDDVFSFQYPHLEGVVIVGDKVWIYDQFDLIYSDTFLNNPPPGFERLNRPMVVDPGTWQQVVD